MERPAGVRLAASYVNFLVTNGGVIMPAFGLPESDDRCALSVPLSQAQTSTVRIAGTADRVGAAFGAFRVIGGCWTTCTRVLPDQRRKC